MRVNMVSLRNNFRSSSVVFSIADRNGQRMALPSPRVVRSHSKSETHVSSKFESVDYDVWSNDLLIKEEQTLGFNHIIETNVIRWCLYFLVGLFTGFVAAFIDVAIHFLMNIKNELLLSFLQTCNDGECTLRWYTIWPLQFIIPVLISVLAVVFIAPNAAGSGIPYLIAFLNGVQTPKVADLKLLIVKVFGVILISISGLAIGREGPFIHIGAVVGSLVISGFKTLGLKLPVFIKRHFPLYAIQEKRDLMTAGCASGFAAAFGSPIGGTLLSLEEGISFWNVHLMWKIFFCSVVTVFTFNTSSRYLRSGNETDGQQGQRGLFYFGEFANGTFDYTYMELPIFMFTGVIGGLFGAFYVWASMKVDHYRKIYVNNRRRQIIEALSAALLTAILALISISIFKNCRPVSSEEESSKALKIGCCNGTFNRMTFYWLNGQEATIRRFFHGQSSTFQISTLVMYIIIYFGLFILMLGVKVPVGLFIPSILLGSAWGRLLGEVVSLTYPQPSPAIATKYAVLGAGAMVGGVVRVTISLAVVMIEATGSLTFSLPIMITFFITKWVGDFFTEGIYETQIHSQGLPILPSEPPVLTSDITAKDLMNKLVVAFPTFVSVDQVVNVLKVVVHQGFPVVEQRPDKHFPRDNNAPKSFGELRGFILRSQLLTLLLTKSFTPPRNAEDVRHMLKLFRKYQTDRISINDIKLTEEERMMTLDLGPYMNPSPYSVQAVMSFPRIFRLLRSLGLRHVIVVNNQNEVLGIISRKDLAKLRLWRHATTMGLKELRVQ